MSGNFLLAIKHCEFLFSVCTVIYCILLTVFDFILTMDAINWIRCDLFEDCFQAVPGWMQSSPESRTNLMPLLKQLSSEDPTA